MRQRNQLGSINVKFEERGVKRILMRFFLTIQTIKTSLLESYFLLFDLQINAS